MPARGVLGEMPERARLVLNSNFVAASVVTAHDVAAIGWLGLGLARSWLKARPLGLAGRHGRMHVSTWEAAAA